MYVGKYREVIQCDLFNIVGRLRAIDKDYFIVRNHEKERFEVHHKGQIGGTFCLTVPYNKLDARTVQLVKESRIEYIEKIFAEVDKHNQKLEEEETKKRHELFDYVGREMHSYLTRHEDKDTIDEDSEFLKGVL